VSDLASQLSDGLKDRYVIDRELGRGGMATVYLAHDLRHERMVALKVVNDPVEGGALHTRFQQEIRVAARLTHPHVLTVFDSGETSGHLWFTMPFVEGESLRDRLMGMTRLSIEQSVRIAREAAQALSYAHRHNIIHRDIKPENILLTDEGNTLVADFGIARAIQTVTSSGTRRSPITEVGTVIGTPAYMSPEQRVGVAVDIRTDIYSLGVVLMEMLTGQTPGGDRGLNPLKAIKKNESIQLRPLRPEIPAGLEQVVQRALTIDPTRRFQSMEEFDDALEQFTGPKRKLAPPPRRYVALAAGLAALAVVGIYGATRRSAADGAAEGRTVRIAVLPFTNQGDSSNAYFAGGLTDAVRTKLTGLPGFEVIASTSSAQYEGTTKTPREIGDELGVEYLLVGKVRWNKGATGTSQVQVVPELIQTKSGAARWSHAFDAALTDVFTVQAEVAEEVVLSLGGALDAGGRQQLAERPTTNLEAYDYFLRGEAASQGAARTDPVAWRNSIPLYRQAIARDSGFGLAWAHLSHMLSSQYLVTLDPEDRRGALAAADRAIALGPDKSSGYLARAYFHRWTNDPVREQADLDRATALAPNDPVVLRAVARSLANRGRGTEAVTMLRKALSVDPRNAGLLDALGLALVENQEFAEGEKVILTTRGLQPGDPSLLYNLIYARLGQGNLEGAREAIVRTPPELRHREAVIYASIYGDFFWLLDRADQDIVLTGTPDEFEGDLGSYGLVKAEILAAQGDMARARAYADTAERTFTAQLKNADDSQLRVLRALARSYLGRKADALVDMEQAVRLGGQQSLWYIHDVAARASVRLGETDRALNHVDLALKKKNVLTGHYYRFNPAYAALRGNPRFEKLVAEKP
jgi:serine/threonine-protein kinase